METIALASEGLYPKSNNYSASAQRLASGILQQALRDLAPYNPGNLEARKWRRDAIQWFFSEDTAPGSVSWVCRALDLDLYSLRRQLCVLKKLDPHFATRAAQLQRKKQY
ncbi:MAG TPA: hypothetical protein VKZ59_04010 [Acidobacteriota bacterium]|nr:hypothetical protein [Acidobacteriota bacterium]